MVRFNQHRIRWRIIPQDKDRQALISREFDMSQLAAQILINRGYTDLDTIHNFLRPELNDLFNPFLMKDMEKVVLRLKTASEKHEKVMIYGDYDVDGITSIVMLINLFKLLKIKPFYYVPNRQKEGYGIKHGIFDKAKNFGVSLIITADCGITALQETEYANKLGMQVIITDHHEPGPKLPDASAVVNPLRHDCYYPDKNLAGCGIIFKLIQGIKSKFRLNFTLNPYLELTALGTVADVAKLIGENRIIVKKGLYLLSNTKNHGLNALKSILNLSGKRITSEDIGFKIGPRLNAAGRLDDADLAIKLLLAKSMKTAMQLAYQLEEKNSRRQKFQMQIFKEAESILRQEPHYRKDKFIVIAKQGWHKGVIGIVASKFAEKYLLPALVISLEKNIGYGSARSLPEFNLYDSIQQVSTHLIQFGGHKMAAGLLIKKDEIPVVRKLLNHLSEDFYRGKYPIKTLDIDAMIKLSVINNQLIQELRMFSPFGNGNPRPLFAVKALKVINYPKVIKEKHLLIELTDNSDRFQAFGYNLWRYFDMVKRDNALVDTAFIPDTIFKDHREVIQLKIKDIRIY